MVQALRTVTSEQAPEPPRQRPPRLHQEVLAPLQAAVPPAVTARARRALAVLAAGLLALQLVGGPLGRYLNHQVEQGNEVAAQWEAYASRPAPDVLFLGPSEARTDVDRQRLAAALTAASGRLVTVGSIGAEGEGPAFIDILVHRVMHRSSRPRLIVQTVETPMFNASLACQACWHDHLTSDTWQVSDLSDPGFVGLALRNDPNRVPLVSGWVLPAVSAYPGLPALGCPLTEVERQAALALTGRLPLRLAYGSSPCDHSDSLQPDLVMTPARHASAVVEYREVLLARYQTSAEAVAQERDLVRQAQAGGTRVVFLKPPFHSALRELDGEVGPRFDAELARIRSELGVPLVDLSAAVPDQDQLWEDPFHLNGAGAARLAPVLASALAAQVGD